MKNITFLLSFIIALSSLEMALGSPCLPGGVCQDYGLKLNFNNPNIAQKYKRMLIKNIFQSKVFNETEWSPRAFHLVEFYKEMVAMDPNGYFLDKTFLFSVYSFILLSFADSMTLACPYVLSVNSSIYYHNWHNSKPGAQVLNMFSTYVGSICNYQSAQSLFNSNCEDAPATEAFPDCCSRVNDIEYDTKLIWMLFGDYMPCRIKYDVYRLQKSKFYEDRVIALAVVLSVTPVCNDIFTISSEYIQLIWAWSDTEINECCCEEKYRTLLEFCNHFEASVKRTIDRRLITKYTSK